MQILLWKPQTWPRTRSCSKPQPRCWPRPTPPSRKFSACCNTKRNAKLSCKTIKKDRSAVRGPVWLSSICLDACKLSKSFHHLIFLSQFPRLNKCQYAAIKICFQTVKESDVQILNISGKNNIGNDTTRAQTLCRSGNAKDNKFILIGGDIVQLGFKGRTR